MDLRKLSLGARIMSLASVLLLFDLLFLPWHRISIGIASIGFSHSVSRSGIQSPNGFIGLLAALVAVAILARVVLSEFTTVELPTLPVSWQRADLLAGAALAALVALKLVLETSYLSIGAWLAIPLAGAVLYGGYQRSRESTRNPDASPANWPEPSPS
jgi:hypothetical protein